MKQKDYIEAPEGGSTSEAILTRLQKAAGVANDSQLADFLEIKRQGILRARKSGVIPPGWLITISIKTGISLDWLYYGVGSPDSPYLSEKENIEEVMMDIVSRLRVKDKIYLARLSEPESLFDFIGMVSYVFESLLEIIIQGNDFTYSYFIFIGNESSCYYIVDHIFDHSNNSHKQTILAVENYFSFTTTKLIRLVTNNYGAPNMARSCYESQNIEQMNRFFNENDPNFTMVTPNETIKPSTSQAHNLRDDIDYIICTLKQLGSTQETIQNAVLKIIGM